MGAVLQAAIVVGLAVWVAWTVAPLLKAEHNVVRHPHQLHPDRFVNAQGLWLQHYAAFPANNNPKYTYTLLLL